MTHLVFQTAAFVTAADSLDAVSRREAQVVG